MSQLLDEWVRTMREGNHEGAWRLSEQHRTAAIGSGQVSDDPRLPYHLRWVWDGRPFDHRHVLVRCYHGLGDTIQFLRFLPALRRRAASVTLEIQPHLIPLLDEECGADKIVPFDPAAPVSPAECDIEITELSEALRLRPRDCPPPYIRVAGGLAPKHALALCCQAGAWDPSRSIRPELLAPLCLGRDCVTLDPLPSPLPVRNPAGCPLDIEHTAGLLARSRLVITVDTMVAHLAGTLGRPTWLLLKHRPDWRWTPQLGRSEWYPSMRLYPQPSSGAWASVVARVRQDLSQHLFEAELAQ
jgi:hypothetical protein